MPLTRRSKTIVKKRILELELRSTTNLGSDIRELSYKSCPITLVVSQIHHHEFAGLKVYKIGKGIQKT